MARLQLAYVSTYNSDAALSDDEGMITAGNQWTGAADVGQAPVLKRCTCSL